MTTLVLGASGATGRLLVNQLLAKGQKVKAIVRSRESFYSYTPHSEGLKVIGASILDLSIEELKEHLKDCDAVASCLGHNLSIKGIFGRPRKLVRDAIINVSKALEELSPSKPVKILLMNTAGNSNRDLKESISFGESLVMGLIRTLLPPQRDNEQAADFLRTEIGQNHPSIEWAAIRPDSLIDNETVSDYQLHPSPVRSAIFNPGKTSRINVANLMAELICDDDLWQKWKGQMPLIYNSDSL